jgi:hypothetical protein
MNTYTLLIRFGAVTLIFFVLLGGYGYWYTNVSAKSGSVVNLTSQIAQQTRATSRVAAAKAELDTLAKDQAAINQYFVSTNNVVPFLESLQTTGTYFGSTVTVASVSAVPGTRYGHLELSLKIVGPFNAVMRTIGAVEYQSYDTEIQSLTFDTPQQGTNASSTVWTAAMQVNVGTQSASKSDVPQTTSSTTTSS